ncbi:MAG TPA: hypothetical protein VNN74_06995 [Candidatus Micrarchaeia archaeon]|nr:hypothetical protein [Candidatus Micrarchaeia archaeon]
MSLPRRPVAVAPPMPAGARIKGRAWLAQLDALLWELESANLRHHDRCPGPCWTVLAAIHRAILPLHRSLPDDSGSTAQALDLVFALQEIVQRNLVTGEGVE